MRIGADGCLFSATTIATTATTTITIVVVMGLGDGFGGEKWPRGIVA